MYLSSRLKTSQSHQTLKTKNLLAIASLELFLPSANQRSALDDVMPPRPALHRAITKRAISMLNMLAASQKPLLNGQRHETMDADGKSLQFATLSALVERCVTAFELNGDLDDTGSQFVDNVILVHPWYRPSPEFFSDFVSLYQSASSRCEKCSEAQSHGSEECASARIRTRLCYAVNYWIHSFPMHFDGNKMICKSVDDLKCSLEKEGLSDLVNLLDVSSVPSYAWLRNVSVRNPIVRQISLSFEQWTPDDLATCLTHIELKMLKRITFSEYKQYACTTNLEHAPILERSISVFNSLSNWVQCMVLTKSTPKERADIMVKFLNVGKHLRKLQNFNTMMAVVGGLTHSALARLTKTYACLTPEMKKDLSSMAELLSHESNFTAYRRALEECRGFRIPIIGVHLKDMICVHAAVKDYNEDGLVNLRKMNQLASIFSHLILDLDRAHNLPDVNMDLVNTLKVSLDIRYKEEEIYELSLKREPRTLLNFQSACPKPLVFAEWAAGVNMAPDAETVNKHVAAMVDAVFKHYDSDRDDYISQTEFEQIAGNFPFIDPFVKLDADRDGRISKEEMQQYFIHQHSNEFRRGFRHNFHETTFLTPTTCVHCNRLLWGIFRQGYKCTDCGIPVHRVCKDSAVAECRRPTMSSARSGSLESPDAETHDQPQNATHKRRLFLNIRSKPTSRLRTVSTASGDSPSPDPTPPVLAPTNEGRPARLMLPKMNRKLRTCSETNDCDYRCQSPDGPDILPSLASEEVFEEETSSNSGVR